jgi:hypothetical protein
MQICTYLDILKKIENVIKSITEHKSIIVTKYLFIYLIFWVVVVDELWASCLLG